MLPGSVSMLTFNCEYELPYDDCRKEVRVSWSNVCLSAASRRRLTYEPRRVTRIPLQPSRDVQLLTILTSGEKRARWATVLSAIYQIIYTYATSSPPIALHGP